MYGFETTNKILTISVQKWISAYQKQQEGHIQAGANSDLIFRICTQMFYWEVEYVLRDFLIVKIMRHYCRKIGRGKDYLQ